MNEAYIYGFTLQNVYLDIEETVVAYKYFYKTNASPNMT